MTNPERTKFLWVCSYPKSGNTWMRLLLREYFKACGETPPFETSDSSIYFYQTVSPIPLSGAAPEDFMQMRGAAMLHMQTILGSRKNDWREWAVCKSHNMSGELCGVPMFSKLWADYVVYVYRDPRDIAPSFADHVGATLEDAVATLGNSNAQMGQPPKIPAYIGSWSEHVRSFLMERDGPALNLVATSYERLHADTAGELTRILEFCNIEVQEDAVEAAVEACAFERLQAQEAEEGFQEASKQAERFFRRGIVGSHRDEVPEKLVRRIEDDHRTMMKLLDYLDD